MKSLKKPTANQKGLKKLPKAVRNKMGYAKDGMKYKNGGKSDPKKPEAKADPRKAPKVASKKSSSESLSTQVKRKIKTITGSKGLFPDVKKYENGGKNDPKKKKKKRTYLVSSKQFPELAKRERDIWKMKDADKSTAGRASVSSDDASLEQSLREGGKNYKKDKHGQKLAPRTMMPRGPKNKGTRFRDALRGGDQDWRKQKYEVPNKKEKSLKGRTSGKSGNVGSGIKLDPKKKRRRR